MWLTGVWRWQPICPAVKVGTTSVSKTSKNIKKKKKRKSELDYKYFSGHTHAKTNQRHQQRLSVVIPLAAADARP